MLEDMRRYVKAGLEALSAQGSEDVASAVRSRAQGLAEQLSGLAAGFLEWSSEARASLLREVRDLVSRQIEEMGLATKQDLEAIEERVARLESASRSSRSGSRRPTPKKATSKTSARGSTLKRSTAKRSGTKSSARSGGSKVGAAAASRRSGRGRATSAR